MPVGFYFLPPTIDKEPHTLTIRSASGDATAKFTIEAEVVPPAPESTNACVLIVVGVVAHGKHIFYKYI